MSFGVACLALQVLVSDAAIFSTGLVFMLIYPALYVFFKLRNRKLHSRISKEELQLHIEAIKKSKRGSHASHRNKAILYFIDLHIKISNEAAQLFHQHRFQTI